MHIYPLQCHSLVLKYSATVLLEITINDLIAMVHLKCVLLFLIFGQSNDGIDGTGIYLINILRQMSKMAKTKYDHLL